MLWCAGSAGAPDNVGSGDGQRPPRPVLNQSSCAPSNLTTHCPHTPLPAGPPGRTSSPTRPAYRRAHGAPACSDGAVRCGAARMRRCMAFWGTPQRMDESSTRTRCPRKSGIPGRCLPDRVRLRNLVAADDAAHACATVRVHTLDEGQVECNIARSSTLRCPQANILRGIGGIICSLQHVLKQANTAILTTHLAK